MKEDRINSLANYFTVSVPLCDSPKATDQMLNSREPRQIIQNTMLQVILNTITRRQIGDLLL